MTQLEPEFREAMARARRSSELTFALKVLSERMRSLRLLKVRTKLEGRFPLSLEDAADAADKLGYATDTNSWCKAVAKLTSSTASQIRRERLALLSDDNSADDDQESDDALDDFLNSL